MFNSVDKFIVEQLIKEEKIYLFSLHQSKGFSPVQLRDSVTRLKKEELIIFDRSSMCVSRAPNFEALVFRLRHKIYNRPKAWRRPPKNYNSKLSKEDSRYMSR